MKQYEIYIIHKNTFLDCTGKRIWGNDELREVLWRGEDKT